jgi:hypothetical protein
MLRHNDDWRILTMNRHERDAEQIGDDGAIAIRWNCFSGPEIPQLDTGDHR